VAVSDGVMIQMMARENSEVYQTDVAVLLESVRARLPHLPQDKSPKRKCPHRMKTHISFRCVMLHRLLLVITLMVIRGEHTPAPHSLVFFV